MASALLTRPLRLTFAGRVGNSYTRTGSDSAPATDVATRTATHPRTTGDSAPAVDVATGTGVRSRTGSDSAPATEVATRTAAHPRTTGDSAPAVDTIARSMILSRAVPDSAPAVDVGTRTAVRTRTAADTALGSDALTTSADRTTYLLPDSIVRQDGLVGTLSDIRNSATNLSDATWMLGSTASDVLHVTMEDPPAILLTGANKQRIRILVRPS